MKQAFAAVLAEHRHARLILADICCHRQIL